MRTLVVALRKDLLLQWRGRIQIVAIFAFGAAALLLFSFAIGPDSLALRHDGFKFSKIENDIGTIETPHRATNDFARSIFEFLINHFLLGLANPLHHRLFGSLRCDTSEIFRRDFNLYRVADVYVGLNFARFRELDLILWIRYILDYQQVGQRPDFAALRINIDAQIARRADALLGGRKQRVRNRLEQNIAFDSALPLQVIEHGNKFRVHKNMQPAD